MDKQMHTKGLHATGRFVQNDSNQVLAEIKSEVHGCEQLAAQFAAAPELLAALQRIVTSLVDADEEGLIEHAEEITAARAAIAKAKAKEQA